MSLVVCHIQSKRLVPTDILRNFLFFFFLIPEEVFLLKLQHFLIQTSLWQLHHNYIMCEQCKKNKQQLSVPVSPYCSHWIIVQPCIYIQC